jgi:cell division protein FtsL
MTNHFIQAYKQAPWRTQVQWIGLFMLFLVIVAAVASIYLNVSASAAAAGREIQGLEDKSTDLKRSIADLETSLAMLTSASNMHSRAVEMGFEQTEWDNPLFITIPGYTGRQAAVLAPPPGPGMVIQPVIRSAYTQSLWDWLFTGFLDPVLNYAPVQ